jgi:pSer/pThr/pTyr-binding forkhead associated (FHA) protein
MQPPQPPQPPPIRIPQQGGLDFGNTVFHDDESGEGSDTVILDQDSDAHHLRPHLVRRKNQERIMIQKETFRMGRDASFVDYAMPDNKFIGHLHCHISTRNGEYFIVDANSKNHTFVDGVMIPGSTEVKIAHGSSIKLANEEFEFRLF